MLGHKMDGRKTLTSFNTTSQASDLVQTVSGIGPDLSLASLLSNASLLEGARLCLVCGGNSLCHGFCTRCSLIWVGVVRYQIDRSVTLLFQCICLFRYSLRARAEGLIS